MSHVPVLLKEALWHLIKGRPEDGEAENREAMDGLLKGGYKKNCNLGVVKQTTTVTKQEDKYVYLDCTFGAGGYSRKLLEESEDIKVIAFDVDPEVGEFAQNLKSIYGDRFIFINKNFSHLSNELDSLGIVQLDGIVADLGVSSMQLDIAERGFSFNKEAHLDMRMSKQGMTAEDFVNSQSEEKISEVIFKYGGERFSRRIAREISSYRKSKRITTTLELANIIKKAVPKFGHTKIDPATKSFQAIRIYINEELENLKLMLNEATKYLAIGGKLVIVSFHSLEDKIVKDFMFANSAKKVHYSKYDQNKKLDTDFCFDIRTYQLILPSEEEIKSNNRSRSSKLRCIKKINNVIIR